MKVERNLIIEPSVVTTPYPIMLKGKVTKGFGRGSKELGIPTANLPESVAEDAGKIMETGIYYGWASVGESDQVWEMVMSFGWNPFYKNEKRSAEIHIINKFPSDFYDEELRIIVTGYIRPEQNYTCLEDLIEDINLDIQAAILSLKRESYLQLKSNEFLKSETKN
ncbi:riboflavin kinase [Nowakowskiella sp. JEL0407]|nr:riboflavin kinase [Nowakowskiella sp. JEL0407]